MKFNVTGIDALGKKDFKTFSYLKPQGTVRFRRDTECEYDPYAIEVIYGDNICIGYVPGKKENDEYVGSELQKHIIEDSIEYGHIENYAYFDEALRFNDQHKGLLKSVTIRIGDEQESDNTKIIGGRYLRVTTFIKAFNWFFTAKEDYLIRYAFANCKTYDEYLKHSQTVLDDGTDLHNRIEDYLNGKDVEVPQGFINWQNKYKPEVISMEQRFYDSNLMVTGKYDLLAYIEYKGRKVLACVDFKSSKEPRDTHKFQLGIYSSNMYFDGEKPEIAMVLALGAENKQQYKTSVIARDKIASYYEAAKLLRKLIDTLNVWIPEDRFYADE